jgi:hypothetical protein
MSKLKIFVGLSCLVSRPLEDIVLQRAEKKIITMGFVKKTYEVLY